MRVGMIGMVGTDMAQESATPRDTPAEAGCIPDHVLRVDEGRGRHGPGICGTKGQTC